LLTLLIYQFRQLKKAKKVNHKLIYLRLGAFLAVLLTLFIPFIFQQTFFPFYRFGMFAEPVSRDIQKEHFAIHAKSAQGLIYSDISAWVGIRKSNMDYLLRNYYYRHELDSLLRRTAALLPDSSSLTELNVLRIMNTDTTKVARLEL